jgi:hypothetical protein
MVAFLVPDTLGDQNNDMIELVNKRFGCWIVDAGVAACRCRWTDARAVAWVIIEHLARTRLCFLLCAPLPFHHASTMLARQNALRSTTLTRSGRDGTDNNALAHISAHAASFACARICHRTLRAACGATRSL